MQCQLTRPGAMFGELVLAEAERVYTEYEGSLSSRMIYAASKYRPLSYGARERLKRSANDLAFTHTLCLV